jgi:hypothetical protein
MDTAVKPRYDGCWWYDGVGGGVTGVGGVTGISGGMTLRGITFANG